MSENTRRQQIEAMLQEEPDDTFLQYALAMELDKEGLVLSIVVKLNAVVLEIPAYELLEASSKAEASIKT